MIQAISTTKREKSKSLAYIDVTGQRRRGVSFFFFLSFLFFVKEIKNFPRKALGGCVWSWMGRGILRRLVLEIGECCGGASELEESVASLC